MESFKELSDQRFGPRKDDYTNWEHYQYVVKKFFDGLYLAVDIWDQDELIRELDKEPIEYRGFVYEGAGMGVVFLDSFLPYKSRYESFLRLAGTKYELLAQIGAGMTFGYLGWGAPVRFFPWNPAKFVERQDPMQRWLVMDGYGFFNGMVNWQRTISEKARPRNISGYGLRAFDQGVGRSLWICTGGDSIRFTEAIATFSAERQADLWGGIGEGCAYAGGVAEISRLRSLIAEAGEYAGHLAAGVAVGAVGRVRAEERSAHTDRACQAVWGVDSLAVVDKADQITASLTSSISDDDRYEQWRSGLRDAWAADHQHVAVLPWS